MDIRDSPPTSYTELYRVRGEFATLIADLFFGFVGYLFQFIL